MKTNKIVAIHQPNLLPHIGLIKKYLSADVFVVLLEVDMNYRDYINRVKLWDGWGTIEVTKAERIAEVEIKSIDRLYNAIKGKYGPEVIRHFTELFDQYRKGDLLWEFNLHSWKIIVEKLYGSDGVRMFNQKMRTDIDEMSQKELKAYHNMRGSEKMAFLTQKVGGNVYLSGAGGKNYIQPEHFIERDLILTYQQPIKEDPMNVLGYGAPHYIAKDLEMLKENYLR